MLSSGAFEIYANDVLEYSKLETGRMPDMQIIMNILAKHNIHS
jgi:selT/selW/selH-like putative selenoprotein